MSSKVNSLLSALSKLKIRAVKISNNRNFKYGVPFLVFMLGGSFGLREWTKIRYEVSKNKSVSKEEAEKLGLHKDREVTIEDVYEEIQTIDIDNWENKRGPRPWEDNVTK